MLLCFPLIQDWIFSLVVLTAAVVINAITRAFALDTNIRDKNYNMTIDIWTGVTLALVFIGVNIWFLCKSCLLVRNLLLHILLTKVE